MGFSKFISALALLTMSLASYAHHIEVHGSYIRETIPGTQISSAYMTIRNNSEQGVSLEKVTGNFSPRIEIHEHTMVDGMMRMGQVDSLIVEANSATLLQPSGYHLMIFDLATPLSAGSEQTLTFHFSDGSIFDVSVPVTSIKRSKSKSVDHSQHNH